MVVQATRVLDSMKASKQGASLYPAFFEAFERSGLLNFEWSPVVQGHKVLALTNRRKKRLGGQAAGLPITSEVLLAFFEMGRKQLGWEAEMFLKDLDRLVVNIVEYNNTGICFGFQQ